MFTFKEFITEGRDAPLYHGTTLDTAMQILKHDMIQGRTNHENRILGINKPGSTGGVSLSRSFKISEWFGEVIFELDQRKLTHNYRINPVQFFSSQGPMLSARTKKLGGNKVLSGRHTEAEEFVIGSIKNVSKYITKIHIPEKSIGLRRKYLREIKDLSLTDQKYDNPWIYEDKEFYSENIGDYVGFVYEIHDTITNSKYIGKKQFGMKKSRPPLKGKKRRRIEYLESDWKTYYGSNEILKEAAQTADDKTPYKRTILRLCKSKSEMSYFESKEIFVRDALLREDYFNSWISCRINANTLKNLD